MAVRADMVNKALRRMGLLRADATTTAHRNTDMGAAFDEVYAELEEEMLVNFPSDGTIPNKLVQPIVALMAFARLDEYRLAPSKQRLILAEAGPNGEIAKSKIRRLGTGPEVVPTTRFKDY